MAADLVAAPAATLGPLGERSLLMVLGRMLWDALSLEARGSSTPEGVWILRRARVRLGTGEVRPSWREGGGLCVV